MGNWLIRNMGKIIKAKKKGGGGIESKVIEEYTPLKTQSIYCSIMSRKVTLSYGLLLNCNVFIT